MGKEFSYSLNYKESNDITNSIMMLIKNLVQNRRTDIAMFRGAIKALKNQQH